MIRLNFSLNTIMATLLVLAAVIGVGQTANPVASGDFLEPDKLATMLKNPKEKQPVVFNVGPMDNIKGAINIGPGSKQANLDKLKKSIANVPKDKIIVVYCGCCPMRVCPNVKPAYNLLTGLGYKNTKILDLKQNLKTDWIDQGFPMQ
jgi:thiosulfate/3-mercaptopyruvate sulfurtransferase